MTDQLIEGPHAARSTLDGSPFPAIADYGFLSDCEVSALVAPNGNVEWMCLPRMDGPSVFAAMLDRGAGWFRLGPADVMVPSGRRYLPGTMVLETTWGTPTGWAVAFSTPYKMFKRYSYAGGTCDPLVIHWPAGIEAKGEVRHQYHHVTDIVPTLLDCCGLELPDEIESQLEWAIVTADLPQAGAEPLDAVRPES